MIEIPKQGAAFFASDLHLSEETPKTLEAFEIWLASVAQADTLIFLLGDVFEVWYGDDYSDPTTERVAHAIQSAHATGAKVYFMHGNRDFLLGETFAETAEFEILPDPEFLLVHHKVVLITHGDQLCTDDKAYQKFRQQSPVLCYWSIPCPRVDFAPTFRSWTMLRACRIPIIVIPCTVLDLMGHVVD